jgi:hypothetical protein
VNAVALSDIRSFVAILLRGLGFVYFKGSENVNPFVEADPQVDVQSQDADLSGGEESGIRETAII